MPTGGFIGYSPTVRGTFGPPANSIFLIPLVAQQNGSVTAVLIDFAANTATTTIKSLIYDGSHSALLATSTQGASIAANYNRFALTTPLSITAGTTYYVGYVSSTAQSVTGQAGPATAWFVSGGQSVASPANPLAAGASNSNVIMIALELDGASSSGFGFSVDQATGITLSASNTVATYPATATRGARSIVTQVSGTGKWYAEVVAGGTLTSNFGIGLTAADWGVLQGTVARAYVAWLLPTGTLQGTSGTTALGLTYVSGDVIGIAYDATANLVWFNKNNGSWFGASSTAGNPATGTGGAAFQGTQWPVTVSGSTGATGTAAILTLRDTAGALQYVPPSGFSAWSAATYPVVAGARRRQVMVVG